MAVEFKLPDLGEGIHEAEVLDIRVKVGDHVKADQILFEVETDKAAVEVPSPYEGIVEKIMCKVGDIAKVGNVMITFQISGDVQPKADRAKAEVAAAVSGVRENAIPAGKHPAGGNGKTAQVATLPVTARTAPAEGPVAAAPATRRLARDLGVDLRLVAGSGPGGRVTKEDVRAFSEGNAPAGRGVASATMATATTKPARDVAALSMTAKYGGGGAEASGGPLSVQPIELPDFSKWGQVERVPLRSLRRKIAISMSQSWEHVPRVSNFDEADITDLENARRGQEAAVAQRGGKLTLTVVALKAVVSALKKFPQFNASLDEASSEIIFKHYYNIGVAVATDRGLIVPVIRNVDQKNLLELSIELADIAQKTRDGKIELDRLQGGTFTITNIGPIGGTGSVPMVNYPEAAIMGMARSADKPVVRNGQIVIRNILPLSMSFDHRIGDGAEAAMFLRHVASCLENPFHMFLEV
jgi:pyruvate dehydrogenase E2 component (dihydrolipoamide acetyltransferase)